MTNLAEQYRKLGRLSQAEPMAVKAMEGLRRVLGENRNQTLWAMQVVSKVYLAQGKLREAEPLGVKALEDRRRVLGDEHGGTRGAFAHLVDVYLAQGKWTAAEQLYVEYLDRHPGDRKTMLSLTRLYQRPDKYADAVALMEKLVIHFPNETGFESELAWLLATCPTPQARDASRAVALARRAIERAPDPRSQRALQNTLGVALYRAGDWEAARDALGKSRSPINVGSFFLAMAHWQLGDRDQARAWYDKAVAWMDQYAPRDEQLLRFRAEAAALLGLNELPDDVFARP
jgi:tetratricopeptide (TPR) repeat protein